MSWKYYFLFGSLNLLILLKLAFLKTALGNMDVYFYNAMELRIARSESLSKPFMWHCLNDYSSFLLPSGCLCRPP